MQPRSHEGNTKITKKTNDFFFFVFLRVLRAFVVPAGLSSAF